jgi:hypothetical protein
MVRIDLADSNSSALLTIPENTSFKYVVMPMRIYLLHTLASALVALRQPCRGGPPGSAKPVPRYF